MWKDNAKRYLGIFGEMDPILEELLDSCYEEVKQVAEPKFMMQRCHLQQNPLMIEEYALSLPYSDLEEMLSGCHECLLVACTLGPAMDRKITYYSHVDMARMSVFDAVASAYIEEISDAYEAKQNLTNRTMRFCPGYGNVPISLNRRFADLLSCHRHIGLYVSENDLLLPMKSMIGIIGIGRTRKKDCYHCVKREYCELRKRGRRCYSID